MSENEIERVAEAALADLPRLVEQWFPAGTWRGREYVVGDLQGNPGDSLSINTHTGAWADFATQESGGDPVSLYAAWRGYTGDHPQLDAARDLAGEVGAESEPQSNGAAGAQKPAKRKGKGKTWTPILPVPADAPAPPDVFNRQEKDESWTRLDVSHRWEYRDAEGRVLGCVCRFDLPGGGKEVIPQTYCEADDGTRQWRWLSFSKPRPLYGLDRLAAHPNANVVVVEGEKPADAGQRLLGGKGVVVVSWPGGGKAIHHADWTPLAGRKVVAWPDADDVGRDTVEGHVDANGRHRKGIAQLVEPHAAGVRVVDAPPDVDEGWDLADAERDGWTADDVLGWVRQHVRQPRMRQPTPAEEEPPPPEEPPADAAPFDEGPPPPEINEAEPDPFVCVGYDHSAYYYLPRRTQQVVRLPTSAHSKLNLLELAPLWWWERQFPGKQGVDWVRAADTLITLNSRHVYDPSRVRGAGAWYDEGRAVLHLGDHLLVDGAHTRMLDIDSRAIYEAGPAIEGEPVEQLSATDANRLVDLCEQLEWERPIDGRLLAGWCVIAPICGALQWRPHVWLTGQSGSGKSWVAEHVVKPCLGPTALPVQGHTTEAGIRQALRQDARPILFDEAEAENRQGQQRIQSILDLARQASSEANGAILKGTTGGQSMVFRVRSAFCLVSIGVSLQQQADQTRWTKLVLRKNRRPTAAEDFARIEETAATLLTPAYCAALRARAYRLIPVIRDNARVFARAAAVHLGSQRLGDQMGALLAGAYTLFSAKRISHEAAREWIERQDWEQQEADPAQTDEERLVAEIVETPIRVEFERGSSTRSIAELIAVALKGADLEVEPRLAEKTLARVGVRTQEIKEGQFVSFSCSHKELKRILTDTPWSLSWADILRRAPGAFERSCVRFGGKSTRAVSVPAEMVLGGEEEGEQMALAAPGAPPGPSPWGAKDREPF